ncbi:MAG: MFS transporter [Bacillota bacterium]
MDNNLSRKRADKILLLLGILLFFNGLGGGVAFPIIPLIGPSIGISAFFVSLILSSNRISRLFFNGVAGEIVDRFGCKGPLIIGTLIKALGVTGYALAIHSPVFPGFLFFLARFFFGIGSAFGFITVYTLMFHLTEKENRGSRTAYIRTASLIGFPAGLFFGGLIANYFGFTAAFLLAASFLYLLTILAFYIIPRLEIAQKTTSLTPLEAIKLAASDPSVLKISMVNLLERFSIGGVFLATTALFVKHYEIQIFNLGVDGMSGFLMASLMFAKGLSTLSIGKKIDAAKTRTIFSILGAILGGIGFLIWAIYPTLHVVIISLLLLGICSGILSSPLLTLLGDVSRVKLRGRTLGIYQVFGDIGASLGPIFGINIAELLGFSITYIIVAILLTSSLLLIIPLYRKEILNYQENKEII